MNERTRERVGQLFDALSNPARLRITELLCHSKLSVNEICSALSLGQSATSQNLATLTRAGILAVEQKGANRIYRVRGPRIGLILAVIEEFCAVHQLGHLPETRDEAENEELANANDHESPPEWEKSTAPKIERTASQSTGADRTTCQGNLRQAGNSSPT